MPYQWSHSHQFYNKVDHSDTLFFESWPILLKIHKTKKFSAFLDTSHLLRQAEISQAADGQMAQTSSAVYLP